MLLCCFTSLPSLAQGFIVHGTLMLEVHHDCIPYMWIASAHESPAGCLTAPGVEEHGDYANSNLGSEPQLWLWSPMSATVKTWYMWHGHPTIAGIIVGNP
jgi:hypothetical protein